MNMMKALIPSTILTLIVSALVGPAGLEGGFLNMQHAVLGGYAFYWSWTLFFTAMALNGAIALRLARTGGGASDPASSPSERGAHADGTR